MCTHLWWSEGSLCVVHWDPPTFKTGCLTTWSLPSVLSHLAGSPRDSAASTSQCCTAKHTLCPVVLFAFTMGLEIELKSLYSKHFTEATFQSFLRMPWTPWKQLGLYFNRSHYVCCVRCLGPVHLAMIITTQHSNNHQILLLCLLGKVLQMSLSAHFQGERRSPKGRTRGYLL